MDREKMIERGNYLLLGFAILFVVAVSAIVSMSTAFAAAFVALMCVAMFCIGVILGANGWD